MGIINLQLRITLYCKKYITTIQNKLHLRINLFFPGNKRVQVSQTSQHPQQL